MTERVRAVRLIPQIIDLPQCSAKRQSPYANDTAATDKTCVRKAKILYNGKPLCLRHAEVRALHDMLAKGS